MSTGIQVDLTALTAVYTDLRRDVDQGLTPSTHGATGELGDTARFGGTSASGEVIAGATDVTYAASIAAHNAGVHIDNAYAIASLIEGAVTGYRIADGLAGREFSSLSGAGTPTASPPDGGGAGASGAGLTPVFVGPLPAPKIPRQELTPAPHALNWNSYDTPRMWSMVSREVSEGAWRQMHAFRRLSEALSDQHRRMLALRSRLVAAWSPQGAGEMLLDAWDKHTSDLESDAMCAYLTAKAMENILQTLEDARAKLAKLNETWQHVTSDYLPEWWDHKAELTNTQARLVMVEAEKAIADFRRMIAVPAQAAGVIVGESQAIDLPPEPRESGEGEEESQSTGSAGQDEQTSRVSGSPVPPLPWHEPTQDGPGLAGSPIPTSISPMSPPSLLPIPPGMSSLAPNGGAYVLPGPWSRAGAVLPMPIAASSPTGYRSVPNVGTTSNPFGVPLGMPGGIIANREPGQRTRVASEKWEVAIGVEPVIGAAGPFHREQEEPDEDERSRIFREWFGPIAMPWDIRPASPNADEGVK